MSNDIKDYEIEITVKIKEKQRSTYGISQDVFSSTKSNLILNEGAGTLDVVKEEVYQNINETKKLVGRFISKTKKSNG